MWILDSCYRGAVELWVKEGGSVRRVQADYTPFFYLHLADAAPHRELIDALDSLYPVEECTFRTVCGCRQGYRIGAGRSVALAIESQTRFAADLYNVDVRPDQRFLAERGIFPCSYPEESRFSLDFPVPLTELAIRVHGDPHRDREIAAVSIGGKRIEGDERRILSDLSSILASVDPDVILFPDAAAWLRHIRRRAEEYDLEVAFSRSGEYREIADRSYWSYGRREYKSGIGLPDGRILVDTARSFTYREGGLAGILLASRLTALPPSLAAHVTPGTLISAYEIYEAVRRGIAVPFRKGDAEHARRLQDLRAEDRGGMILQPRAGLYEGVGELDFTSLYPSLIVKHNLSPETLRSPARDGFLPEVLRPLLALRRSAKRQKRQHPGYASMDAILKWMLVTCFGYTGYRNAKFGRIEVHESVTHHARDVLLRTKRIAEAMGFAVVHGIVDCLWVQGGDMGVLKAAVEEETELPAETETYDWIVFLPMPDGYGAYNRYFGRLADGSMKMRGVMARRRDTPEYVRRMQQEMLQVLGSAADRAGLAALRGRAEEIYFRHARGLACAAPEDLVIRRRINRPDHARNSLESAAVRAYGHCGIEIAAGMEMGYVVRDAGRWLVDTPWDADSIDLRYYCGLLEKAWSEVAFCLNCAAAGEDDVWPAQPHSG
ncbi:MAG: type B DNA-directed DNA polymerase [Methanomicrobiales archaeon]|nr:type B DNA-directed DNA polymerase [Methanomicrobiales archaeon]MDI6876347.1 type B DNA-directed DNA polymerase [Methanomicrobiales archaeon]